MTGGYDAIVLAGGPSRRMGGRAKPQLSVGGATMLEHVLSAVGGASSRIVVGPPQPAPDGVQVVTEAPAGAGPVAAVAAGLTHLSASVVVVVAADLPFLTAELISTLIAGLTPRADVALLIDEHGRDQYLLGAWRAEPLRARLTELAPLPGRAMHELVATLRATRVEIPAPSNTPAPWTDIDTPSDLDRARDNSTLNPGSAPEGRR